VLKPAFFLLILLAGSQVLWPQENQSLPIEEWAYSEGMEFWWDPITERGLLQKAGVSLVFRAGDPMALFRGTEWIPVNIERVPDGRVLISADTRERLRLVWNLTPALEPGRWRIGVILIDPGHGGRDPGTVATHRRPDGTTWTIREKDVVLRVAKELAFLCRNGALAPKVVLTRDDDTFLTLEERVELAHAQELGEGEIIIFISIHANASINQQAKGFEVWHIPVDYERDVLGRETEVVPTLRPLINQLKDYEYKTESLRISQLILEGFQRNSGSYSLDRGLREEAWFVVRMTRMPAVLVELGFVTNPTEASRLVSDAYLKNLALAMYDGLRNFSVELESGRREVP